MLLVLFHDMQIKNSASTYQHDQGGLIRGQPPIYKNPLFHNLDTLSFNAKVDLVNF